MASTIYPLWMQSAMTEADTNNGLNINTTVDGPYALLIDTGVYTYNALHDFKNDVTGIIGATDGVNITTPTVVNGIFDGNDITFTAVTGASVEAIIIYRHNSGANTTWRLFCFLDGFSVTPNSGDITVTWHASGIVDMTNP
jgi:hypothetical protein